MLFSGNAQEEQQSRESLMRQTFGKLSVYTTDTWNTQNCRKSKYVLLVQAGAILRPEAVYKLVRKAEEAQKKVLFYMDHDIQTRDGHLKSPFCKPDYDPVLQSQMNYLGPVLFADAELIKDMAPGNAGCIMERTGQKGKADLPCTRASVSYFRKDGS